MSEKAKNKENIITDEEALKKLLLDIECLDELLPWTCKFNLFDVLKISKAEIRHSNMLAWLLNPNENHGLGDGFLRGILHRLVEGQSLRSYDVFDVFLLDCYSFSVEREWKNIDILLISTKEKLVIAIENKVGSHEHSNQLNRYREILERDYAECDRIHIFLTPDGEAPSDEENWIILTYEDLVEVLEDLCAKRELMPEAKLLIDNYISVVRRDIVKDPKLIEICNKIYNEHKRALDLIYENRIDNKSQLRNIMNDVLYELCDEEKIIYWGSSTYGSFHTQRMDTYLKALKTEEGSWGTDAIYYYWFEIDKGRIAGVLELGGKNVPPREMKKMQCIIDVLKPSDNRRDEFVYKKVYRTKWYPIPEEYNEEKIRKTVIKVVGEILAMEERLFEEIGQ